MEYDLSNFSLRLSNAEISVLKSASEITITKYLTNGENVTIEDLFNAIEDLTYFYNYLNEEKEKLERNITENYVPNKDSELFFNYDREE